MPSFSFAVIIPNGSALALKTTLDMAVIGLKQIKKETYLDLSEQDIAQSEFISDFAKFADETSSFLSGTTVSLILPEESEEKSFDEALAKIQFELNKRNISLRNSRNPEKIQELESKYLEQEKTDTSEAQETQLPETLYVKANLRSGQLIQYPGNVVVVGDVNPSAEIVAAGDIVVWGTLRGVVHAGAGGDNSAIISALKINSGQLRISDRFIALPNKSSTLSKDKDNKNFSPETAKIVGNEIKIVKGF